MQSWSVYEALPNTESSYKSGAQPCGDTADPPRWSGLKPQDSDLCVYTSIAANAYLIACLYPFDSVRWNLLTSGFM